MHVIKKYVTCILLALGLLAFESKSAEAMVISGQPYYVNPNSSSITFVGYNHYRLVFFWVEEELSNRSVHIVAGNGCPNPVNYAADGSYSFEIPDEMESYELYCTMKYGEYEESSFYECYSPEALDFQNAIPFIPGSLDQGNYNPVFLPITGEDELQFRNQFINIHGRITLNNLSARGSKLPVNLRAYNNGELVKSVMITSDNYSLNIPQSGNYRIVASSPLFRNYEFNVDGLSGTVQQDIILSREGNEHINTSEIPANYRLQQNYPNPFNPSTNIGFTLPFDSKVSLKVFDVAGKEVAVLINNEFRNAASYNVSFNASFLNSGIYIYRLEAGNFVQSKKMILLK